MPAFDVRWVERWQNMVNQDSVARLLGRHFNADVMLEFGPHAYVVSFEHGAIGRVQHEIGPESAYQFAQRAPAETWAKFVQPVPPPMYNDIIAMSHTLHGRLKIEGDVVIDLIFTADRRIVVLRILHSIGYGLDETGVQAVSQIVFRPATANGRAVDFQARARVEFRLVESVMCPTVELTPAL